MSVTTSVVVLSAMLVVLNLFLLRRQLTKIENRLGAIATKETVDDSLHDTLHPVFSVQHLRKARQRFEESYREQLRLEKGLYESSEWAQKVRNKSPAVLSEQLQEHMRRVCEAVVEAECNWKEYAFMIDGNVSVADRGSSGEHVVEAFHKLLKETRGMASADVIAPNRVKLERVNAWFEDWTTRLVQPRSSSTAEARARIKEPTPVADRLFKEAWEDRNEWEAQSRV